MKGFSQKTIEEVREKADILAVVGSYVDLSEPSRGEAKGCCPFHEEKTPSFTVSAEKNLYYCFGCGETGDTFTFVQQIDGLTFPEAIRRVAATIEDYILPDPEGADLGGSPRRRLIAANDAARAFYSDLLGQPEAGLARTTLEERGFDVPSSVVTFGCGYAPRGWNTLLDHLHTLGFTDDEVVDAGLAIRGEKGVYDRFRGRLMWPIYNVRGEHVGFGGRRLYDDDDSAKYLNSPETMLYKKSSTLYGLHMSKEHIKATGQVIVVEGYTDVMAAYAAGVRNVIASSGTAFGEGHLAPLRALLATRAKWHGSIAFCFDGDAAGRKAATSAWRATLPEPGLRTYAIHTPAGMDPCDLRMASGNEAVRETMKTQFPLGEFCITHAVRSQDISDREGRIAAVKEARWIINEARVEPIAAREYAEFAAEIIGCQTDEVFPQKGKVVSKDSSVLSDPSAVSGVETLEREALKVLLQVNSGDLDAWVEALEPELAFSNVKMRKAAGVVVAGSRHPEAVEARCASEAGKDFIRELAVEPLVTANPNADYAISVIRELMSTAIDRIITDKKREAAAATTDEEYEAASRDIAAYLEARRDLG